MTTCQWLSKVWSTTTALPTVVGYERRSREKSYSSFPCPISRGALTRCRFPINLPFSQMYPLCCLDIRNFLNKYYFFSDEYFQHQQAIDEELKNVSLDIFLLSRSNRHRRLTNCFASKFAKLSWTVLNLNTSDRLSRSSSTSSTLNTHATH